MLMNSLISPVDLTDHEKTLVSQIDLYPDRRAISEQPWSKIADNVEELMRSLLGREAIPIARLRYFADPECNVGGRGSSREYVIRRNGGTSAFRSPAFLRYLRYFLKGPDLPARAIEAFQRKVIECGEPFTGRDALVVAALASQLTRSHRLAPKPTADEFYKLALECELDASDARTVREKVMSVRS